MTTHSRQMAAAAYNNARMRYPLNQDESTSQQRPDRGTSEERRAVGKYGTGRSVGMSSPTTLRAMLDERTDEVERETDRERDRRSWAYNNGSGRGQTERTSGTDSRTSRAGYYDSPQLPPPTPKRMPSRPASQQDSLFGSGRYTSDHQTTASRPVTQQIKNRTSVNPEDIATMGYHMQYPIRGLRPRHRNNVEEDQIPASRYLKGDEEIEPYPKDLPFEVVSSPPEPRHPVSRGDMSYQYHALNTTPEDSSTDESDNANHQQYNEDWAAQQEYVDAELQHTDSLSLISKRGVVNNQPQQEQKKLGLCPKDSLSLISDRLRIRKDSTPKSYSTNSPKYDDWGMSQQSYRTPTGTARRSTEAYHQNTRQSPVAVQRAQLESPGTTSSNTRNPREMRIVTPRRAVPCRSTAVQYCEPRRDVVSRIVRHGTKNPSDSKRSEINTEGQELSFISRVSVPSQNTRDGRGPSTNRAHSHLPMPVWRLYKNEE